MSGHLMLREPERIEIGQDPGSLDPLLEQAPGGKAVFLIWPREGAPYLGRTNVLRRRLKRLLGEPAGPSRRLNLRGVAQRVEYWQAGSALETQLVYYDLARRHFPDTYLHLVKLRMPAYVKLILTNTFPRTQTTARPGGRALYYGPFRTRAAAEQFEADVLELFQIRRCQEDLAPSPDHPGCIYGEMGKCMRPCQQAVSVEEYRAEAERVAAFLASGGHSLLESLETARERFSDELRFEDAAREHKRIERIQEILRGRDGLASEIYRLNGVAVTASVEPGAVELWFVMKGCWQPVVRFGFEVVEGKTVSMDHRLRELASSIAPGQVTVHERQEHLALLARWYYSSWRDGEWLSFCDVAHLPYRKLVNAISRVASGESQSLKPVLAPHTSGSV